jgi:hypothetical protein
MAEARTKPGKHVLPSILERILKQDEQKMDYSLIF